MLVMMALLVTSALMVGAWLHLSKPTILRVAVGPAGFADAALMASFSRSLTAEKSTVRLSIEHTSGPHEALSKLINGEAELAVMRADGPTSERIRAVAILH